MHHAAWVIAPFVLVGVLVPSAVAKWGKGALLRKIIRNLRLSERILPEPLARAIPGIELALVAGLLTPWRATFALTAGATLVLMVVYWALIARGLTITPRPSCGCFGQAGDHRISGRTLLRNTLLVACAGAAAGLAGAGLTVWSLLGDADSGDWLWLALAALACGVTALVLGRFGPQTPLPDMSDGPERVALPDASTHEPDDYLRAPTPELLLQDRDTGPVTLLELSAKRAQLLVFVNCYCASTRDVIAELDGWNERLGAVDVRMVFSVPIVAKFVPTTPPRTLVDHRGIAWRALGLAGSPAAVLLGADGHLAGGPVSGAEGVRAFIDDVERALSDASPESEPVALDPPLASDGQLTGGR